MQFYISFLKKITSLITELELSLDKSDDCFINVKYSEFEEMLDKTKNYIKELSKNEKSIENEMEKYYNDINLYISDINNIVLKKSNNNKIKIDEFNFLNEIIVFKYFNFKLLNGLNKNTKIVIVQYLKNITDIVLSFKGIEPLQIVQDIVKDIVNVNDIQKKNTQKGRKKFSKNKNLNNLITDIGGMVENMMKDGKIQDLVEDIKNDLESTNQDPMEIFQSLLSGKNNKFINNTMNKVKSKIDKGELNIDFNLDKHKDDLSNIDINDISNMVFENIQKMNNKK